MGKINCWEVKRCGRHPGGENVDERGPCPAASQVPATGINGGAYGGRACWAIDRTFCKRYGYVSFPEKFLNCMSCSFYHQVWNEEGRDFIGVEQIRTELEGYRVI